jgi:hypothetical protein
MKFPSLVPVAIACSIAVLISSAPAEDDIAALKAAAAKGSAEAQFNVGVELLEGDMENRDPAESLKWRMFSE